MSQNIINDINFNINIRFEQNKQKIAAEWKTTIEKYQNIPFSSNLLYFYTSFANEDIFDGQVYEMVYPQNNISIGIECKTKIVSFIDEWLHLPVEYVGKGHRAICVVNFLDSIPGFVMDMDIVDKNMLRYPNKEIVLCSKETWIANIESRSV